MTSNRRLGSLSLAGVLLAAACSKEPAPPPATNEPSAPVTPLIQKKEASDWCGEHGVPESICTRCNAELVASFKAKNDWCAKHELPDSQCLVCHPELQAKFEAMAPKAGK
jgi:hypothetical protein